MIPSFMLFICYTLFSLPVVVMTHPPCLRDRMMFGVLEILRMCKCLGIMVTCETKCKYFIPGSHDWVCVAGPISGPKEAEYVLQRTRGVHGFYGASSMERLPVEEAIAGTMQQYKAIQIAG